MQYKTTSSTGLHLSADRPRIAFLGSRGIPAEYGGFETFIQEVSLRLVDKGFDITVFCHGNQSYKQPTYRGVRLVHIDTPPVKGLRSVCFDAMSILKSLARYDILYVVGYNVALLLPLARLFPGQLWVNMDGLGWKRSKWSPMAQRYLRSMESTAVRFASHIIADSQSIADHLTSTYAFARGKVQVIEYGAYPVYAPPSIDSLAGFNLQPQEYYIVVCRLEPENHVQEIIEGYCRAGSTRKLVVVGDHTTGTPYVRELLKAANENVTFIGTVFDQVKLTALRYYCHTYFHGHSVGGTNPSLLEAMACGNYVIAHDNVFNREVTQNQCVYFSDAEDMKACIFTLEQDGIPADVKQRLKQVVVEKYNWDGIAERYAKAFEKTLSARKC